MGLLIAGVCRWALMFLSEIEEVVQRVYKSLRPGGVFVMMEKDPFRDINISPPADIFDKIYEAAFQLKVDRGRNPDIVLELPEILQKADF